MPGHREIVTADPVWVVRGPRALSSHSLLLPLLVVPDSFLPPTPASPSVKLVSSEECVPHQDRSWRCGPGNCGPGGPTEPRPLLSEIPLIPPCRHCIFVLQGPRTAPQPLWSRCQFLLRFQGPQLLLWYPASPTMATERWSQVSQSLFRTPSHQRPWERCVVLTYPAPPAFVFLFTHFCSPSLPEAFS